MIEGSNRVLRGGSWNNNARNTRSANRNRNNPDERNDNNGFRLALARTTGDTPFDQIVIRTAQVCGKNKMHIGAQVDKGSKVHRCCALLSLLSQ
ncbi:MAG: SUMF1/EgtB/PvdO family nonheme iron enzyme [Methylococcaceae bacterium]